MTAQYYDVIGDVHGHADALCRLLTELGYEERDGVFRHETRKLIFVGDLIDRGPGQVDVLRVAKNMRDVGTASAVLGNHEFNALGWSLSDGKGGHLRPHTRANRDQHDEFLKQLVEGSEAYKDALDWFRRLPVWRELPGLHVIHACWHEPSQTILRAFLDKHACFTNEGLIAALHRGSDAYQAAEILLKGPELSLPDGVSFLDKGGHERREVRLRWWDPDATTFRKAAIGMEDRLEAIPETELNHDFFYKHRKPVLFGHYWMKDTPTITHATAACLDFSVAKDGYLTAYRWSGESALVPEHLVHVRA